MNPHVAPVLQRRREPRLHQRHQVAGVCGRNVAKSLDNAERYG
jgi:hypothetical protein